MHVGFSTLVSVPILDRPWCGRRQAESPITESSSHSSSFKTAEFFLSVGQFSSTISDVGHKSEVGDLKHFVTVNYEG
jgi:hypothetical protein